MSRFKPGQQIVCSKKGPWKSRDGRTNVHGPGFNEVVTATGPGSMPGDIVIKEYKFCITTGRPQAYDERCFEPLVSDEVLREELMSVPEPFTM